MKRGNNPVPPNYKEYEIAIIPAQIPIERSLVPVKDSRANDQSNNTKTEMK